MIIDTSYFTGNINLPQTGNTEGSAIVTEFISRYEPVYLQAVLGYSLWKAFTDGIEGSGEIDQRWENLLSGGDYTYKGSDKRWTGFMVKPSPISQYIYYHFVRDQSTSMTLVGNVMAKTENADRVNPLLKMVDAWNEMVRLNWLLRGYLDANAETYPEYNSRECYENEIFLTINEFGI